MRCLVLLWRRMVTAQNHKTILFFILLLNVVMIYLGKRFSTETCYQRNDRAINTHLIKIQPKIIDDTIILDEFDWKKETKSLSAAFPAIGVNLTSVKDPDQLEYSNFSRSQIADPLMRKTSDSEITSLLSKTYNPSVTKHSIDDAAGVYNALNILNCKDIDYLEKRTENPQLTYSFIDPQSKRGELRLRDGHTVNVVKYSFEKRKYENQSDFRNILEHFYKLLKTQGWPGIPRLYGVCLQSKANNDVMLAQNQPINIECLSYVTDRYDDGIKLCKEETATDDCVKLSGLRRFIKTFPHPGITSLKIMKGFGETFESLWLNGVFPFEFYINDLIITKDFQLVFQNLDSFVFLDPKEEPFSYKRSLSDTMCKTWKSCPVAKWRNSHFLFRMGQSCKEVQGYCFENNRCWGLDSMSHLCALSKWVFHQLSMVIPYSWKHFREVTALIVCASHSLPEDRCDWTAFARGVDTLLQLAIQEWGEE